MGIPSSYLFMDAAGREYGLAMHVCLDGMADFVLDPSCVEQFEYQTQMNDLVARGSFTYVDRTGSIDALLCRPYAALNVSFKQYSVESDGQFSVSREDGETSSLESRFLIENVGILERRGESVRYKVSFSSATVVNCLGVVDFTNYGRKPEPVLDILRQIAVGGANLTIDEETFGCVKQQPRMNYITNGSDNLFTASKFLLDKLYYRFPRSESMVFVFWDELGKKLRLFDMANADTATGRTPIVLSMFDSGLETTVDGVSNELGTVTKMPVSQTTKAQFQKQIASYDYATNRFEYDNVTQDQQRGYMNARFQQMKDVRDKYVDVVSPGQFTPRLVERGSYWNNDFHFYGAVLDAFLNSNALMIKAAGRIDRQPGCLVDVAIDKGDARELSENPSLYDDMMTRFKGLEGTWVATRVHNYISPNAEKSQVFRQVLTLARNFVIAGEDSARSK